MISFLLHLHIVGPFMTLLYPSCWSTEAGFLFTTYSEGGRKRGTLSDPVGNHSVTLSADDIATPARTDGGKGWSHHRLKFATESKIPIPQEDPPSCCPFESPFTVDRWSDEQSKTKSRSSNKPFELLYTIVMATLFASHLAWNLFVERAVAARGSSAMKKHSRMLITLLAICGGSCCIKSSGVLLASAATGDITKVFSYTGGEQTFVVPADVTSLTVHVYGAQGAKCTSSNCGAGGRGGYIKSTITVNPDDVLYINVAVRV